MDPEGPQVDTVVGALIVLHPYDADAIYPGARAALLRPLDALRHE